MTAVVQEAAAITVNGREITTKQINEELQYHPASSFAEARESAARALVVRELLLQEALHKGLLKERYAVADEQSAIDALLESEVRVPAPDLESCKTYYKNNKHRFVMSPLFEVSHILFAASLKNEEARRQAESKAGDILSVLQKEPHRFEELARQHSGCSSAKDGGRLGQISKGQTAPEFEEALLKLQKDEISQEPVATIYGYHLVKVHERIEGKELPFEAVHDWIADYLKQSVWQRAVSQYISLLGGKADIKGFHLKAAQTPLVQ